MTTGTAYLLVDVAGTDCALPRRAVREILPLPRLWRPPAAPAPLAGFLNLAGSAVPVLDLAILFGLVRPAAGATARIALYRHLVLLHGESPLALMVDRVRDFARVAPDQVRPVADAATLNGCVAAEIRIAERLVHGLAVDRILLAEEQARLAAQTRDAQARLAEWAA
ncbi:chemotaxis protein CheW [Methylobacterium platani]|uniref:Chemotaxis protein CheW n=2 Tax=Methylobacterium platani TaxID=427683 RepID=A0A179S159_9HYPH|nr:chemotaxis protein CheW [Methylobacterium platani]KMO22112.1 chemotaxis protein CheW [Methylobacterium platani JCM 14648]OAS15175.1 chemotaxis protein CheW [Methylobacterium platani]